MSELEQDLRGLAVAFPPEPDVADRVRAQLTRPAQPLLHRRRVAVAIALFVLAALAALAVPAARSALRDLFDIGGAEIRRVDRLPATGPNGRSAPGRPMPLAEARDRADFAVRVPAECDRCDTVLFDDTIPGGRVTIVWPGVRPRLFLMEFRGQATPFVQKLAAPQTGIRTVAVGRSSGYWVSGSPHAVTFRDAAGRILSGRRLARNVLLWERDGVTYRLEGDVTLRRALTIAMSLR